MSTNEFRKIREGFTLTGKLPHPNFTILYGTIGNSTLSPAERKGNNII
jgi:hypothetical protein